LVIRRSDALKGQLANFKQEILTNPNFESVSNSSSIPGRNFWSSTYIYAGDTGKINILLSQVFVNYDFFSGLRTKSGKRKIFFTCQNF